MIYPQLSYNYINQFRRSIDPGIKKLCSAVFKQAVRDIRRGYDVDGVMSWMMYDGPGNLFSFLGICEVIELDPHRLRLEILKQVHLPK